LIEVQNRQGFSQVLRELISKSEILLQFRKASLEKSRDFDIQKVVDQYQIIFQNGMHEK